MVALKGLMKDEKKNLDLKKSMKKRWKDVRSLQFNWKSEAWALYYKTSDGGLPDGGLPEKHFVRHKKAAGKSAAICRQIWRIIH